MAAVNNQDTTFSESILRLMGNWRFFFFLNSPLNVFLFLLLLMGQVPVVSTIKHSQGLLTSRSQMPKSKALYFTKKILDKCVFPTFLHK